MREKTYRTAMGGLLTAAAVAVMFLGSVIPFATFAAPAFAALCVLYFCLEYGGGTAALVYAAVALLSALLVPDKEQAFLFVCVFGPYPIIKKLVEARCRKPFGIALKMLYFNATVCALYYIITRIFVMEVVRSEFADYTTVMLIVMLVLGNLMFYFYDIALTRMSFYYFAKLKPKLVKH
ncbi:MAG: hypothetical protein VB021_02235 [Oscillospiraceae bacterium]|nr:hypothetical protein [Oscillospiraceae bacterium]